MAAIADFYEDVFVCTDRPDLRQETAIALRRALRACHYASEFQFDVQLQTISGAGFPTIVSLPDRYRATLRLSDNSAMELRSITPRAYFDMHAQLDKRNVYWTLGSNLEIRALDGFSVLYHYYLQTPDFADSRIAADHRDYLVYTASALVLTMIDEANKAARFQNLAQECFVELERQIFVP